jgi:hypothetical protein
VLQRGALPRQPRVVVMDGQAIGTERVGRLRAR